MRTLSLHQPYAQLVVIGTKKLETRSWPCPPNLIGQRIAIHATQRAPDMSRLGGWDIALASDKRWGAMRGPRWVHLPLGAIVGSATIEACYPTKLTPWPLHGKVIDSPGVSGASEEVLHLVNLDHLGYVDISDQLPYGDYRPGRYAWLLTDAAPVQERCPWCGGAREIEDGSVEIEGGHLHAFSTCPVCEGAGRCDPIPARGRQRTWRWKP